MQTTRTPPSYKLESRFDAALIDAKRSPGLTQQLIVPHRLYLDVGAVDADSATLRIMATMVLLPGLEVPQMFMFGQLWRNFDDSATLKVRVNPFSMYRYLIVLSGIVGGLILMRLRIWLGLAFFGLFFSYTYWQTVMLLNGIDVLLKQTFGAAIPVKRKTKRPRGHW